MEEKYRIFNVGFNKVLDLIETVDKNVANKYKKLIDVIPEDVLEAVSSSEDFATENEHYNVDFMRLVNAVSLDFTNYKKYMRADLYVHRLFEEDLFTQGLDLKIFSLNIRNTPIKPDKIEFHYEEKNGHYNFKGTNDSPKETKIDTTYEMFLKNIDNEYYISVIMNFRGIELINKNIPIDFDDLTYYIEQEEDFEEDLEVEFDADFDL